MDKKEGAWICPMAKECKVEICAMRKPHRYANEPCRPRGCPAGIPYVEQKEVTLPSAEGKPSADPSPSEVKPLVDDVGITVETYLLNMAEYGIEATKKSIVRYIRELLSGGVK